MTELNHDEHWQQLANPGHHHTRDAILPLLANGQPPRVLNCAAAFGPAKNLTDFTLPAGLSAAECLQAGASGVIPDCLRAWNYSPRIRAVKQLPFMRSLPEKFRSLQSLPWFEHHSPVRGLGLNARHLRYNHELWQQLRPKVLRGVHTTLVLAMPQIGYALTPHIQLDKSFLYLGSLARGLGATQLFPARYLFPDANLGGLADAPAPIFADLLPATCGYAWPCVDLEPDPWRVLTHYERSDRYYGYPFHRRDWIAGLGIDDEISTHAFGMGEFAVINVNRTDVESHGLGILNCQMTQAADAGDGDPLSRFRSGFLDAFIGSDAGADDGCCFRGF